MDYGAGFGAVTAIVGVVTGSVLSTRGQHRLQLSQRVEARRDAKEAAFVAVLTAFHRFSRYLGTQPIQVDLITRPEDPGHTIYCPATDEVEKDLACDELNELDALT